MVLFIHRPALLGLSELPEDFAELIIAKNRSGEMGEINLKFNGDIVKFTDSNESLVDYAEKIAGSNARVQSVSSLEQDNPVVGPYDPFVY